LDGLFNQGDAMSRSSTILEKLNKYAVGNYDPWLVAHHGLGTQLWDVDGNKYLDLMGAYAVLNVGHCHPRIVAVAKAQLEKLGLVSGVTPTEKFAEFCEELVHFCGFLENGKVLPALGGHEAVEKAIKIVRKWGYKYKNVEPNKAEIISCIGSFHGRTYGALSLMSNEKYKKDFGPFLPGFVHIPFGDTIALSRAITPNTVAFFVEPIQGEGGVVVPPKSYLAAVGTICSKNNVLLVVDEIQTGFGRTGFRLACRCEMMYPNLVIVGKGLGGGIQGLSAVVGDSEIMDVLEVGDDGSTFAGNPLGCAVALEAIKVLEEESLCLESLEKGRYFSSELRVIGIKSPYIKEVRGRGLMIGIELTDSVSAENIAKNELLREGILCGYSQNVLRLNPPLNITKKEIDWALPRIEKVL
jgi:ornithine--oxo-acid transaminase